MSDQNAEITLSRDQSRHVDRLAVERYGIPSIVLMENAAINATAAILDELGEAGDGAAEFSTLTVAVLCGGGNNGGDGYAVARHLHNLGVDARLYAAKDPGGLDGDAAVNHAICERMGLPIEPVLDGPAIDAAKAAWAEADGVVDALLGTGFSGEVREPLATLIAAVAELDRTPVIAVDAPSGLDADTGEPSNATVRADLTVTFVARKRGFTADAERWTGRVVIGDIGVPPALVAEVAGGT